MSDLVMEVLLALESVVLSGPMLASDSEGGLALMLGKLIPCLCASLRLFDSLWYASTPLNAFLKHA